MDLHCWPGPVCLNSVDHKQVREMRQKLNNAAIALC